jgi:hypothetical protein
MERDSANFKRVMSLWIENISDRGLKAVPTTPASRAEYRHWTRVHNFLHNNGDINTVVAIVTDSVLPEVPSTETTTTTTTTTTDTPEVKGNAASVQKSDGVTTSLRSTNECAPDRFRQHYDMIANDPDGWSSFAKQTIRNERIYNAAIGKLDPNVRAADVMFACMFYKWVEANRADVAPLFILKTYTEDLIRKYRRYISRLEEYDSDLIAKYGNILDDDRADDYARYIDDEEDEEDAD